MANRVLIVSTRALAESVVGALVDETAETMVVVPAVDQSRLEWLTNDDDRAREEAARAAQDLADATPGTTMDARAGDPDPVLAVNDALRVFPANELILVAADGDDAGWLEKRALEIDGLSGRTIPIRRARIGDDGSIEIEQDSAA